MDIKKILKDTAVLFAICIIAGLLLGVTYEMTAPTIALRKSEEKAATYQGIFGEGSSFGESEAINALLADADTVLSDAGLAATGVTFSECLEVSDSSGNVTGYAMSVNSKGNQGTMVIAVGYSIDGTIVGIEILESNETAGLGSKASDPEFKELFAGKNVESFTVTKTGASAENEIDAISGATDTTDGVVNAVNAAIAFGGYCTENN